MVCTSKQIILVFLLLEGIICGCSASNWQYTGNHGPTFWEEFAPVCGNTKQSPINIETKSVLPDEQLSQLVLEGYNQTLSGGEMLNNGHTVQLNFPAGKTFAMVNKGSSYTGLQLHFHWTLESNADNGGSEHSVDGRYSDAEMHIVHIKEGYTSLEDVKSDPNGLAVIGVLIKATAGGHNEQMQKLLDVIDTCKYNGDRMPLLQGPELNALLPSSGNYFRYNGSLTTPPCYQSVLWTLYQQPIYISHEQLQIFQGLYQRERSSASSNVEGLKNRTTHEDNNGHGLDKDSHETNEANIGDNYRPTQQLNGRIVTAYYDIGIRRKIKTPGPQEWSYNHGGLDWTSEHLTCGGSKQSPIDLPPDPLTSHDLHDLQFSPSYQEATGGFFTNNGHTVMYEVDEHLELTLTEGPKSFQVEQIHFHWGAASPSGTMGLHVNGGSEHTINNKHFPIEMHIVHSNISPDDPDTESIGEDQFGVIAVLFDIYENKTDERVDSSLAQLTERLHQIKYKGDTIRIDSGPAVIDLLPTNKTYYRYMGSLTTPPCTQAVQWTVFYYPVAIARERILEFQNVLKVPRDEIVEMNSTHARSQPLSADQPSMFTSGNYRPVQSYGDRVVLLHVDHVIVVETGPNILQMTLWTLAGLLVFAALLSLIVCCKHRNKAPSRQHSAKYHQGKQDDDDIISV